MPENRQKVGIELKLISGKLTLGSQVKNNLVRHILFDFVCYDFPVVVCLVGGMELCFFKKR